MTQSAAFEVVLVRVVGVEGRARDSRFFADVVHADPVVSAFLKEGAARVGLGGCECTMLSSENGVVFPDRYGKMSGNWHAWTIGMGDPTIDKRSKRTREAIETALLRLIDFKGAPDPR